MKVVFFINTVKLFFSDLIKGWMVKEGRGIRGENTLVVFEWRVIVFCFYVRGGR
ncbi:hypothetical protein J2T02_002380 [Chitinophaga terrae (ex Kim and Jung 2007)]|jgi:hypothetical protein|nr:hypothetical protein [Chitinophaga terrae (ex Kim and Jung 2007)]